ncbi:MAG: membrane protein insertase YidC [Rikenellaceae bacterium]|nr:membrane protein insertase YidC [Rikenellaceae bacterium]
MKENKSTIIGFVLMTLVFVGYMFYANYQAQKQQEAQMAAQVEQLAEQASQALDTPTEQKAEAEITKTEGKKSDAPKLVSDAEKVEEVVVENDVMQIRFSTLGAQIIDVTLKDYTKYAPKEERNELVHLFAPESAYFNMSYYLKENMRNVEVATAYRNFELLPVESLGDKKVVTMRLPVGEGSIEHIYTIYNEQKPERDYLVDFEVRLNNLAPMMANQKSIAVEWRNRTYQNERSFKNENTYTTLVYHYPGEGDVEDLGISESTKEDDIAASVDWVSFKQQFFSSALIGRSVVLRQPQVSFATAEPKSGYIKDFAMSSSVDYTPQTTQYDFSFYLGPNKFSVLKKLTDKNGESLEMERIIPLGWVFSTFISRWVVIPVFDFLQKYIASFGLIILILTILVKLVIFPLTYKSYLSTAKMRVIKPEIDALNAKYPRQEDAMKKQQEMMALYNKAGISPMGGCLPMLIQMPILIAMFRFFPASIELRGKSFLWSDDLSSYDSILDLPFNIPFYGDHISLFCLLMTIVMFVYSYINYQQQGAAQPQMAGMKFMTVYMMPAMMLFWFNDYASGLCYYYLLSNLFTILQTTIIRFTLNDDKIRAKMNSHAKNTKGKKSRFQQRYEELVKQAEAQQAQQSKRK